MNEPTLVPGFILVVGVFGMVLFAMLWALFKPWHDWLEELKERNIQKELAMTPTPPQSFLEAMGMTKEQRDELRQRQTSALQLRAATPAESAEHYKSEGWSASFKQNQIYRPMDKDRIQIAYVPYDVWEAMGGYL